MVAGPAQPNGVRGMSGHLKDGQWHEGWYDTGKTAGEFVRTNSRFRNRITADGSSGSLPNQGATTCAGRSLAPSECEKAVGTRPANPIRDSGSAAAKVRMYGCNRYRRTNHELKAWQTGASMYRPLAVSVSRVTPCQGGTNSGTVQESTTTSPSSFGTKNYIQSDF